MAADAGASPGVAPAPMKQCVATCIKLVQRIVASILEIVAKPLIKKTITLVSNVLLHFVEIPFLPHIHTTANSGRSRGDKK
jgi:hypothetical protein